MSIIEYWKKKTVGIWTSVTKINEIKFTLEILHYNKNQNQELGV